MIKSIIKTLLITATLLVVIGIVNVYVLNPKSTSNMKRVDLNDDTKNKIINLLSKKMNEGLPITVSITGSSMRLNSTTNMDGTFQINCTLLDLSLEGEDVSGKTDNSKLREKFQPEFIKDACTDKKFSILVNKYDIPISYVYHDINGVRILSLMATKKDCREFVEEQNGSNE